MVWLAIGGCDKNMPGCMMGLARLNRPGVFVYGGTIQPGSNHTDIVSVFEAVGKRANNDINDIELETNRINSHSWAWFLWWYVYCKYNGFCD